MQEQVRKFFPLEEVVCVDDRAGDISGESSIQKGRRYTVIGFHKKGIMVTDGTIKYWRSDRFIRAKKSFGQSIAEYILSRYKIEELLTKRLGVN